MVWVLMTKTTMSLTSKMTPPYFLNEIDATSSSLRANIKKQCCCLTSVRLILVFKNVNRIYAKLALCLKWLFK